MSTIGESAKGHQIIAEFRCVPLRQAITIRSIHPSILAYMDGNPAAADSSSSHISSPVGRIMREG
jgi:hypothetical protein